MAIDPFSFLWSVPVHGHGWIQAESLCKRRRRESGLKDEPKWMLQDDYCHWRCLSIKRHAPPEDAEQPLFRSFADCPIEDRDALLRFANEYGLLG